MVKSIDHSEGARDFHRTGLLKTTLAKGRHEKDAQKQSTVSILHLFPIPRFLPFKVHLHIKVGGKAMCTDFEAQAARVVRASMIHSEFPASPVNTL